MKNLIILVLFLTMSVLSGCTSFDQVKAEVIPQGHARLVFFGANEQPYGLLRGGPYDPELVLDGKTRRFVHGTGESGYRVLDVPQGDHILTIDDGGFAKSKPVLNLTLKNNEIVWIHTEMVEAHTMDSVFGGLEWNYAQTFTVVDEPTARTLWAGGKVKNLSLDSPSE